MASVGVTVAAALGANTSLAVLGRHFPSNLEVIALISLIPWLVTVALLQSMLFSSQPVLASALSGVAAALISMWLSGVRDAGGVVVLIRLLPIYFSAYLVTAPTVALVYRRFGSTFRSSGP